MTAIPSYVASVSVLRTDTTQPGAIDSLCYLRVHAAADFLAMEAELQWEADNSNHSESREVDWLTNDAFATPIPRDPGPFEGALVISRDCPELMAALLMAFIRLGATCRIDPFEPSRGWEWPRYCSEYSEIPSAVHAVRNYSSTVLPDGLEQVHVWAIPRTTEQEASEALQHIREDPYDEASWRRIQRLGVIVARMQESVCSISMACSGFDTMTAAVCDALRQAGISIRVEDSD